MLKPFRGKIKLLHKEEICLPGSTEIKLDDLPFPSCQEIWHCVHGATHGIIFT